MIIGVNTTTIGITMMYIMLSNVNLSNYHTTQTRVYTPHNPYLICILDVDSHHLLCYSVPSILIF